MVVNAIIFSLVKLEIAYLMKVDSLISKVHWLTFYAKGQIMP